MSRFDAVLFDCDGVLVDSEPITNGVLREMLEELGWVMTREECMRTFVGKAVKDEKALIEARTGRPLTEAWLQSFRERRNQGLRERLKAIDGILEAVGLIHARMGGRIACASGADRYKVELQLSQCGLMPFFEGRIFSGHEMPEATAAQLAANAAQQARSRCVSGCRSSAGRRPTALRRGGGHRHRCDGRCRCGLHGIWLQPARSGA